MRIAITDANIFIDLHYLQMLDYLFALKLEIHTTHEVIDELEEDQIELLTNKAKSGQLTIHVLSSEELDKLDQLEVPKGLSNTDKSVYFCANKIDSLVLTGDLTLRKTLERNGKEVHGVVWIFDQWVTKELIPPDEAARLLQKLVEFNSWLPMEECITRINNWKN